MSESETPDVQALLDGMAGLEAGRRVGWAKYYEAETRYSVLSGSTAAREGFVAGVLEQAAEWRVPVKSAVRLVIEYLEGRTDEPEDVEKYAQGKAQGADLLKHYWINSGEEQEAKGGGENLLEPISLQMDQGRCGHCNRLLLLSSELGLSIKCPRCRQIGVHSFGL